MSTNQSLITLIRALRSHAEAEDVQRLLDSATTLLVLLANPLNVTLLTSQLLSASSIWSQPDGLYTTLHILSVFSNASKYVGQREPTTSNPSQPYPVETLPKEKWVLAIVKGADENSPRWRHLCALVGLLVGFDGGLCPSLQRVLESAVVKAANLALNEGCDDHTMCMNSVVLLLSHAFDFLSSNEKAALNHTFLLRAISHSLLSSKDGFHSGYILSAMDADVVQSNSALFEWSPRSGTYVQFQRIARSPLLSCLGSLSRLAAMAIEMARNFDALSDLLNELSSFSRSVLVQWQQNKLSEIDPSEDSQHLTDVTLRITFPLLWHTLRSLDFAITVMLRSVLARILQDPGSPENLCPIFAIKILHIFRNMYFVTSKVSLGSSSQYQFVFLTATDILSQYPVRAQALLDEIKPKNGVIMPTHPLDRCHDLFFLNIAELLAVSLPIELSEKLLIPAAMPYLKVDSDPRLRVHCEAAHSVLLSVLALPNNSELLQRHLRPYLAALVSAFPGSLSPRQFRLGIKSLVKLTSPPALVFAEDPSLPSIVLDVVNAQIDSASPQTLQSLRNDHQIIDADDELSVQATFLLSIIDSLPFLPITQLQPWLDLVPDSLSKIQDSRQSDYCKHRLWQILSSGEMDVDRASLSVSWWASRGRERIAGRPMTEWEATVPHAAVAMANQT